jgi:hypothetical protein
MAVNDLITFRKGTASQWISANPVLASGEPGYDLTNSILKIGDGVSNWVALSGIGSTSVGGSSSSSVGVRGVISTTGNLTNFAVSGGYSPGYLDLFQNGVKLLGGSDFTATDGTSVILSNSVPSGTVLEYVSLGSSVSSSNYTKLDNISSSFNGSSTSFGLAVSGTVYYPVSANTLGIYVGGVAQEPISSYSVSGSNIVFTEAPASGLTFWGVGYGTTAVATLNGIVPGSVSSPAISSSNDLTTGFYFPSSGNISVAGNLGIGTSSPSTSLDINNNKFRIRNSKTPSSTTDTGNQGDICWDSNYIYICTLNNNWQRASLSTWFSPASYSNLTLWLDASDSSTLYDATTGGSLVAHEGQIARWQDKSGNNYHFTQSSAANRPIRRRSIKNGLDVVTTSGGNFQRMQNTSINLAASDYTVFCAFNSSEDLTTYRYVLEWTNFGTTFAYRGTTAGAPGFYQFNTWRDATTSSASGPHVLSWTLNSASGATIHRNNIQVGNVLSYNTPRAWGGTTYLIGDATNSVFLLGDVYELIVYRSVLSSDARTNICNYLLTKWGIS